MISPPQLLRCLSCSLRCKVCLTVAPVHGIEHGLTLGQSSALLESGSDAGNPMSFDSTQYLYCLSAALCDFGQETLMCSDEKIDDVAVKPEALGYLVTIQAPVAPVLIRCPVYSLPGGGADFRCYSFMVIDELLSTFAAA
jgi:hypothetical protein